MATPTPGDTNHETPETRMMTRKVGKVEDRREADRIFTISSWENRGAPRRGFRLKTPRSPSEAGRPLDI